MTSNTRWPWAAATASLTACCSGMIGSSEPEWMVALSRRFAAEDRQAAVQRDVEAGERAGAERPGLVNDHVPRTRVMRAT